MELRIELGPDLEERVRAFAAAEQRSVQDVVTAAIEWYLGASGPVQADD
jgi:predicted transcriptional regulator